MAKVAGYTRKDGTKVKGYTRKAGRGKTPKGKIYNRDTGKYKKKPKAGSKGYVKGSSTRKRKRLPLADRPVKRRNNSKKVSGYRKAANRNVIKQRRSESRR
jgi:hypothetical protein